MRTGKYRIPLKDDIIDLTQELNAIGGIYDPELADMYLKDKTDNENATIMLMKNKNSAKAEEEPEIIDISEDMRKMLPATLRDMAEKIRNYRPSA